MRVVVLFIAVLAIVAGAGFYLYQEMLAGDPVVETAAVEAPRAKEVFVPAVELSAGSILKPEHLGRMPIEDASLTPEMVEVGDEGRTVLIGSVARHTLSMGVPIARSSVVQPGDRGFLAAVLPQGKRAISIPISEVAGISGLVLPGDRVDIILTYSLLGDTIDAERDVRASETVMSNIRVLALDQRLHQTQAAADGKPLGDAPPIARTATLQVTPRQAEMITLATSLGDLSLVLNSVHDGGDDAEAVAEAELALSPAKQRRMTLDSDVTSLLMNRAEANAEPVIDKTQHIQIVRGTKTDAVEFGEQLVAVAPDIDEGEIAARE